MLILCGLVLGVDRFFGGSECGGLVFCLFCYKNFHGDRTESSDIELGTRWISLAYLGLFLNFNHLLSGREGILGTYLLLGQPRAQSQLTAISLYLHMLLHLPNCSSMGGGEQNASPCQKKINVSIH